MKATYTKATRRTSRPQILVPRPSPKTTDVALSQLKKRLLGRLLKETDNPVLHAGLRRAAAEAESLAWLTTVPLLVLPALLQEKAREARFYATRQAQLRGASREWVTLSE